MEPKSVDTLTVYHSNKCVCVSSSNICFRDYNNHNTPKIEEINETTLVHELLLMPASALKHSFSTESPSFTQDNWRRMCGS